MINRLIYKGYLIILNDQPTEKFKYQIRSITDCDEHLDWAKSIDECKTIIDKKNYEKRLFRITKY